MFRPIALFIGLRYIRAKRRNHFISFISLASMIGIILGVAVLITVLSVMNGFDNEIRSRVLEMAPQVTVRTFTNAMDNWQAVQKKLANFPDVLAAAPFIEGQGMLTNGDIVHPAMISGVDPNEEAKVSGVDTKIIQGKLTNLQAGKFGIVIGRQLADSLGLVLGDKVTLVTPEAALTPVGVIPRFKRFTVVGIFDPGTGFGFDSQLALINLQDAGALYQLKNNVTGIRLKIKDLYEAPQFALQLAKHLTSDYFISNWTQNYGSLFKALELEKNMMFLVLLLIVAVAAFNLVSSLVMVVNDKRADIAILRTFGATPKTIMFIFIVQGFIVGLIGIVLGLIGGIILASHANQVVNFIQNTFHVQLFSANVYYLNYLPSKIDSKDVIQVCIAAFILSLLATLYPAWRASRTDPAEALRYE